MPKTTPKPKTKTKQPNIWAKAFTWCKRHPVLTAVIIIVVGFFGYIAISSTVHQLQINKERKQFTQLQTDMTNFYDKLTKQVGQPYAHKVIPSCHYSSAKFEKGFLSCRVGIYFSYPSTDEVTTRAEAERISKYIRTTKEVIGYRRSEWRDSADGYSQMKGDRFNFLGRGFYCGITYWGRDKSQGTDLPSGFPEDISPDEALLVEFSCSGSAKAEYFPVLE